MQKSIKRMLKLWKLLWLGQHIQAKQQGWGPNVAQILFTRYKEKQQQVSNFWDLSYIFLNYLLEIGESKESFRCQKK